jgi:hypothetical protein
MKRIIRFFKLMPLEYKINSIGVFMSFLAALIACISVLLTCSQLKLTEEAVVQANQQFQYTLSKERPKIDLSIKIRLDENALGDVSNDYVLRIDLPIKISGSRAIELIDCEIIYTASSYPSYISNSMTLNKINFMIDKKYLNYELYPSENENLMTSTIMKRFDDNVALDFYLDSDSIRYYTVKLKYSDMTLKDTLSVTECFMCKSLDVYKGYNIDSLTRNDMEYSVKCQKLVGSSKQTVLKLLYD